MEVQVGKWMYGDFICRKQKGSGPISKMIGDREVGLRSFILTQQVDSLRLLGIAADGRAFITSPIVRWVTVEDRLLLTTENSTYVIDGKEME
jgi:hypothetical protein